MDLATFVAGMERIVAESAGEPEILERGTPLLAELVARDDWLPEPFTRPGPTYRQYLLHRDPQDRFSVISFVWGPGQATPVHDHTVWGLVGVLRGAERCCEYALTPDGRAIPAGCEHLLRTGEVEAVSPTVGDVHTVANAIADATSISIHVYGADIGSVRRHAYDAVTGQPREFVSGYTNA